MTEWLDIGIRDVGKGGKTVKRSLDDINQSVDETEKGLTSLQKAAGVAGVAIGAALGGAAVMLYNGFNNAAKAIKETASASKQLGIGVENMSRLDYAAKSADLSTKDLVETLGKLQAQQAASAKPGSEMNKLFGQLKIQTVEANGALRDTQLVLRDVADVFQRMPEGTNKSTLAMKLFGTENRNVIGLLNEGSQGLDNMAKKSDELGYTLSQETAKDVKALYNELDDVKTQVEAMYRQALPGLLPQIKEFSSLLNSPDFKEGFSNLIQGSAQAIIWLGKLAVQFTSTVKTLAEGAAAAMNGPSMDDIPRVSNELKAVEDRIKSIESWQSKGRIGKAISGLGAPLPAATRATGVKSVSMDADRDAKTELEYLRGYREKLRTAVNNGAARDYAEADRKQREEEAKTLKALQDAEKLGAGGPQIDWTKLGRDPSKGRKGPDPAKELERLQHQLDSVLGSINPVLNAQKDLEHAQEIFTKSIDKGLISQKEAAHYMEIYKERLQDQLDPLGEVNRELSEQIRIEGMLNDQREIAGKMLSITEQLKRSSIKLTTEETAALEEQLRVLQETEMVTAAKQGFSSQTRKSRDKQAGIDTKALSELVASGELGGGDKFNILNQLLGGTLDDTQAAFDAQTEQFAEYYTRVAELRTADVLNAKEASDAIVAIKRAELDANLSRTEKALGAAAGLMQSNSKEAFRVGQAAAIGQAIVNTYTAATAAYQSAAAIPYVGWLLGPAAAAGAIAAGMAQVSAIRSQQMPAYRTGGSLTVGGNGGIDSQVVSLRATPGEKIDINTPAQARALERMGNDEQQEQRRGGRVVQNLTIVQQGKPDRKTGPQTARLVRKSTQKAFERG